MTDGPTVGERSARNCGVSGVAGRGQKLKNAALSQCQSQTLENKKFFLL